MDKGSTAISNDQNIRLWTKANCETSPTVDSHNKHWNGQTDGDKWNSTISIVKSSQKYGQRKYFNLHDQV